MKIPAPIRLIIAMTLYCAANYFVAQDWPAIIFLGVAVGLLARPVVDWIKDGDCAE